MPATCGPLPRSPDLQERGAITDNCELVATPTNRPCGRSAIASWASCTAVSVIALPTWRRLPGHFSMPLLDFFRTWDVYPPHKGEGLNTDATGEAGFTPAG